ncbi:unnamed protein product [Schistosoma haematobium]|nr:unnamed protein product [Schistosoma haematobium]
MGEGLKYIGISIYFLFNILDRHQIQSIKCHVCDYCPIVTNKSISNENCTSCAVAGENYSVHRICLRNSTIPTNFPEENLNVCKSDLCNNRIIGDHLRNQTNPLNNSTTHGPTCDQLDHENTVGCCSTDKCNGMTKLSIHRHVIVVLFVCMGISKYIL